MKQSPELSIVEHEKGQGLEVRWTNGNLIERKCAAFVDKRDTALQAAKHLIELASHIIEVVSVDHKEE
jgi:hypothetical protein